MFAAILTATYTFTAVATGIVKGTPVEFLFAGQGTDRDYETVFTLEKSIDEFCRDIEKAGFPRGVPNDAASCNLWPVGAEVKLEPALTNFIDRSTLPQELSTDRLIYTGGARNEKGGPVANDDMPLSMLSLYTLSQSPFQFDGIFEQGAVYNFNLAGVTMPKGKRVKFTLTCDPSTLPSRQRVAFEPGNATKVLQELRQAAAKGPVVATASFSPDLTLTEAKADAEALAVVDSVRIKVNGRTDGQLFYQAFRPQVSWLDRKERLVQPFEIRLAANGESSVTFIDEDWSVEGVDPKLTEKNIPLEKMKDYPKTDTAFVYAANSMKLGSIYELIKKFPKSIANIYVFGE